MLTVRRVICLAAAACAGNSPALAQQAGFFSLDYSETFAQIGAESVAAVFAEVQVAFSETTPFPLFDGAVLTTPLGAQFNMAPVPFSRTFGLFETASAMDELTPRFPGGTYDVLLTGFMPAGFSLQVPDHATFLAKRSRFPSSVWSQRLDVDASEPLEIDISHLVPDPNDPLDIVSVSAHPIPSFISGFASGVVGDGPLVMQAGQLYRGRTYQFSMFRSRLHNETLPGSLSADYTCRSQSRTTMIVRTREACTGDLNGDGLVDDADFTEFAQAYNLLVCFDFLMHWGCPSDFSGDALVDDADFLEFVAAYDKLLCD
jgi:hypothetical protein